MIDQPQAASLAQASILAECRTLILDRLCSGLSAALEDVDRELQSLRTSAGTGPEGQIYVEAQFYLRTAAPNLERSLRRAFEQHFRNRATLAVKGDTKGYDSLSLDPRELSLVDDSKMAEDLSVQQNSRRLVRSAGSEVEELQPRIAALLGQEQIKDEEDPLGPDSLCSALRDVCWDLASTTEVRNVLLEQLVARLANDVPTIYAVVNTHLETRGIRPQRRGVQRAPDRRSATPATQETTPEPPPLAPPPPPPPPEPAPKAEAESDLSSLVESLLTRVSRGPAGGAPARSAAGAGGAPAVHLVSGDVVSLLTRLQHGESASVGSDLQFSVPGASSTTNVLHHLLQGGLASHVDTVDGIIIDVVATLFDHIFDDLRVPELMKGLIGRLQIPVLKLAMLDRGFLSSRIHPARRLINTLAHAATTWDGGFTSETPLFRQSEDLIHRIQQEFAEDPGVFASALEDLESFLSRQDAIADARTAKMAGELERIERTELARSVARARLAPTLADPALPESLRNFLSAEWTRVLALVAASEGENSPAWNDALGVVDDLVWSVRPKANADDRQGLLKLLPKLLGALRSGMERAETAAADREALFADLVKLHATAVKAGLAPARKLAGKSAPPPAAAPEPETLADPLEAGLDGLARGLWMEVRESGQEPRHLRLTWVSPARTMFLFANRQGLRALAMTRAELKEGLASGRVVFPEEQGFIDRIVDHVVASYQPPAQA